MASQAPSTAPAGPKGIVAVRRWRADYRFAWARKQRLQAKEGNVKGLALAHSLL